MGRRAASSVEGQIYLIDQAFLKKPYQTITFSIGNEVPPNSPTPWYEDSVEMGANVKPAFVVCILSYRDSILKKSFRQSFFMKWSGVQQGKFYPDFTHVDAETASRLKKLLELN